MNIVADDSIPFVEHYFGAYGDVIRRHGRSMTREDVLTADVLLVRSVTSVTRELLQGTAVKFVGSVTTGSDHLDTAWLDEAGISWSTAEGCNTQAVVDYVVCIVAALQNMQRLEKKSVRAG